MSHCSVFECVVLILLRYGHVHPEVARVINLLAGNFMEKGHYSKAEELFLEAYNVLENTLGKKHPVLAGQYVMLIL